MTTPEFKNLWLAFVQIKAKSGLRFNELINTDSDSGRSNEEYIGAWANVIIKADSISDALEIVPPGLLELNFEVDFIDKIENLKSLVENNELKDSVVHEAKWLLQSQYVFKISDDIFPFCAEP